MLYPSRSRRRLFFVSKVSELAVGESHPLHLPERVAIYRRQLGVRALRFEKLHHLRDEPRIDTCELTYFGAGNACLERALYLKDSLGRGLPESGAQRFGRIFLEPVVDERRCIRP